MSELLTERLPQVRCTASMRDGLEKIVRSGPGDVSDHIR